MKASIIVPAHNEQDNIAGVIRAIEETLRFEYELLIVDDHSSDGTCEIVNGLVLEYPNIKLVHNIDHQGFANAIKSGLRNAVTDAVVPVMGDLCDDVRTIETMLVKLKEGYDVVCGSRYIKGGGRFGGSKIKGWASCLAGWSLHFLLGVATHDITNPFKMYRKKVIDSIDIESMRSSSFEISIELALKAYEAGFKFSEVPTVYRERTKGNSSFNTIKMIPRYLRFYLLAILHRLKGKARVISR